MNFRQAMVRAVILKALAHPVRVLLVDALSRGDMCVNELTALAGVDQSNVSRHLAHLKRVGIVTERQEGQRVIHHLECPCILKAFDCSVEVLRSVAARQRQALEGIVE